MMLPFVCNFVWTGNGAKTVDVPLFKEEMERETIVKTMQNDDEERTEDPKETKNTRMVEGEIEEKQDFEERCDKEYDDDFEQDLDSYFKNENNPSIEIKNDAHFVLIDDDELFNTKSNGMNDKNCDKVDEWLLV